MKTNNNSFLIVLDNRVVARDVKVSYLVYFDENESGDIERCYHDLHQDVVFSFLSKDDAEMFVSLYNENRDLLMGKGNFVRDVMMYCCLAGLSYVPGYLDHELEFVEYKDFNRTCGLEFGGWK